EPAPLSISGARSVPRASTAAGLFFLVSVMERLGIGPLLQAHPELIELDFPARLLEAVCDRLQVPAEDAIRSGWSVRPLGGGERRIAYCAPPVWGQGLCGDAPWLLRARGGEDDAWVLSDGSG